MPTMKALFRWAFPVIARRNNNTVINTIFLVIKKNFRQIYNFFLNKRLPFHFFVYKEANKKQSNNNLNIKQNEKIFFTFEEGDR